MLRLARTTKGIVAAFGMLVSTVASSAGDFSNVDKHNRDRVVYITMVRTTPEGKLLEKDHGTGFIVSPDGYVLTNWHVAHKIRDERDDITSITGAVRTKLNQAFAMDYVSGDPQLDVALLKLPDLGKEWPSVTIGKPSGVSDSSPLLVLGFPADLDLSAKEGILSNKNAEGDMWQTSMNLNYGDSGSPVLNEAGEVVAMVYGGRDELHSVSFVIPISHANPFLMLMASRSTIDKTFDFYASTGEEQAETFSQHFCVRNGYKIMGNPHVDFVGMSTKLVPAHAQVDQDQPNCLNLFGDFSKQAKAALPKDELDRAWVAGHISVQAVKIPAAEIK